MATITINGTRLDSDDAKTVRRELGKVRRAEAKADAERTEKNEQARLKARDIGFDVLSRKASGSDFPRFWRIYRPGDQWAEHAFTQVKDEPETIVQCGPQETTVRHYGWDFMGAVTNAGGYTQVIFIRDSDHRSRLDDDATCYTIGTADNGAVYYLAELPGIKMSDFTPAGD